MLLVSTKKNVGTCIKKNLKNCKTLPREHLSSCQGVQIFSQKDHYKVFVSFL